MVQYLLRLAFSFGDTQLLPLYRYDESGNRVDNITDWGFRQFEKRYGKQAGVNRESIFHYVYAVLHDPAYREKYALNLKRELPRIPFYDDFAQWAAWGQELLALHIGFETVEPAPLQRIDLPGYRHAQGQIEGATQAAGRILIDEATTLADIPPAAWQYRLGNRSALEWVLDQYKESTPTRPDHPREIQHLPLRRLQGKGHRPALARLYGERRNARHYRENERNPTARRNRT